MDMRMPPLVVAWWFDPAAISERSSVMFRLWHLFLPSVRCRVYAPVAGQENCKTKKGNISTISIIEMRLARVLVSYLLKATFPKAHDEVWCAR